MTRKREHVHGCQGRATLSRDALTIGSINVPLLPPRIMDRGGQRSEAIALCCLNLATMACDAHTRSGGRESGR
jgi:hypothetical protein